MIAAPLVALAHLLAPPAAADTATGPLLPGRGLAAGQPGELLLGSVDATILGPLFRSIRYEKEETELVVIVTAELVEPVDGEGILLPGAEHVTPSDWQLFFDGKIEGTAAAEPAKRLTEMGLDGLQGPGAWQRSDDPKRAAAEEVPELPAASKETKPEGDK